MTKTPFIAAALSLLLGACSQGADQPAGSPAQNAAPPAPAPITLSSRPQASGGEALYVEKCIMCHGPNGMGTGLLSRRMDMPLLEARDDLTKDYVILAARQGVGNMPAISRGEVSDAQMAQIADYLASGPHKPDEGTADRGAGR